MQRRTFLAGAVTILCAGGAVWRAEDQGVFAVGEGPAYAPWHDWRAAQGPLGLVAAAILAASPHNTQPWRFRVGPSAIDIALDASRNVGALDPFLREEHIGIGCALENLLLAAQAAGYDATVTLPRGALATIAENPARVTLAHIALAAGTRESSALFAAIPDRHTNRCAYEPHKPLPAAFLDALSHLPGRGEPDVRIFLFSDQPARRAIIANSAAANSVLYGDPGVKRASDRWIRLSWHDVQSQRDGLTIDCFGLPPATSVAAKMMPAELMNAIGSKQQISGYAALMDTAPLIGIIAVRDRYDRAQCLQTGRIWQRAHLLATSQGIAARPSNEAVERIDYERAAGRPASQLAKLAAITGDAGWQPNFVFCMGYPTLPGHASPRRGLGAVLD